MTTQMLIYIAVMAIVTYLIRVAPFAIFRKKIRSKRLQDVLYYMPYAFLAAMAIPAAFSATGDLLSSVAGMFVACVLAMIKPSLVAVAVGSSIAALITKFIF